MPFNKKFRLLMNFLIILCLSLYLVTAEVPQQYDVTDDGVVDERDITVVAGCKDIGIGGTFEGIDCESADVNDDGVVDQVDWQLVLDFYKKDRGKEDKTSEEEGLIIEELGVTDEQLENLPTPCGVTNKNSHLYQACRASRFCIKEGFKSGFQAQWASDGGGDVYCIKGTDVKVYDGVSNADLEKKPGPGDCGGDEVEHNLCRAKRYCESLGLGYKTGFQTEWTPNNGGGRINCIKGEGVKSFDVNEEELENLPCEGYKYQILNCRADTYCQDEKDFKTGIKNEWKQVFCLKEFGKELEKIWEKTNGPGGGKIIDIAFDSENPDVFYTAVYPISTGLLDGGIYKTTNGGITWQRKINGINDKETWSISVDPNNNDVLWVGTNSGEIYKTTNAGETWVRKKDASGTIENPLSDTIYTIEIDPFNSNNILAGSRHGNLFKSEDGGNNWETMHNEDGLTITGVISDITYDPNNEGIIYLTSGFFDVWDFVGNGIYKSIDGGESWERLENGLEDKTQFGDLVIDPSDSNVIYAANGMETNGDVIGEDQAYLYRSENAGETWERIDIGNQIGERFTLNSVVVHPTNSDRIYVLGQDQRILISEDKGETWELIKDSGIIGIGTFVEYDPKDYNTMYSTTYAAGIFKSTDAGRTWKDLNGKEISFSYVEGMLADPDEEGTLYTQSFENGFHYSEDYGETWERGDISGNYWAWTTFIEKPKTSPNIFVVNRGGGNIKRASSPNAEWELVDIPEIDDERPWPNILAVSNQDPYLLYVGTRENGIFKSENSGDSWEEINQGIDNVADIRAIAIDPNEDSRIYAGSINDKGRLWYSDNYGDDWSLLNNEMTFTTIHAMVLDPNDDGIVYAAPWGAGLFKSSDEGDTWTKIAGDEEEPFSLAAIKINPQDSNQIFATERSEPILWRSEDGGDNWFKDKEIPNKDYFRLNSITLDPDNPEIIYVSAWYNDRGQVGGDLFRINEDNFWEEVTNELPRAVLDVEVDPSDSDIIYASMHVHGLFKSYDKGETWEEIESFPRAGIFDLAFNGGSLYATTNCGELPRYMLSGMAQHDGECGLYVSYDEGNTWINLIPEEMRSTAVKQVSFNDGVIYIATNDDAYVSHDGEEWESLDVPFKETSVMEVTDNMIYVGTHGGGVYQKRISDSSWDSNGPYSELFNMQIEIDPKYSDKIYASSFPGGVFKSIDGGQTWNEKNFALPSFKVDSPDKQAYYSLLINPHRPDNLFLGLFGKGIYMSLDGADTWMPVNIGLDNKEVYNVQIDASGKYLYAGTNGGSVYRADLSKLGLISKVTQTYQYNSQTKTLTINYQHSEHKIEIVFKDPMPTDEVEIISSTSTIKNYGWNDEKTTLSIIVEGDPSVPGELNLKSPEPSTINIDNEQISKEEKPSLKEPAEPTSTETDVIEDQSKTALYSLFFVVIILGIILLVHHSKKR